MTNLRRIDGSGTPPTDDLEASIGITVTWPNTDAALANVLHLVLLVGIVLAPALVLLTWRAVL